VAVTDTVGAARASESDATSCLVGDGSRGSSTGGDVPIPPPSYDAAGDSAAREGEDVSGDEEEEGCASSKLWYFTA
jgi:hypothetical protein